MIHIQDNPNKSSFINDITKNKKFQGNQADNNVLDLNDIANLATISLCKQLHIIQKISP